MAHQPFSICPHHNPRPVVELNLQGDALLGGNRGANQVWLLLVQLAQNLLCWAQQSSLGSDFLLARPKRLRYQLLHLAGRLVHTGRRSILRLDAGWPWARELELAFQRLRALPL